MLRKLRPRSAYDIMAALALFLVVAGGTAFAFAAANSVNSTSIKDGEVKNVDLGKDSVGSLKVINNSLAGTDIDESTLGAVPAAKRLPFLRYVGGNLDTMGPDGNGVSTAVCPTTPVLYAPVGGGFLTGDSHTGGWTADPAIYVMGSGPERAVGSQLLDRWVVIAKNTGNQSNAVVRAYAICAPVSARNRFAP